MTDKTDRTNTKPGFNGQWVEIFATGSHTDNQGRAHQITTDFLNQAVSSFDPETHESPVVIGHPAENAPAWGWTRGLRVRESGGQKPAVLEAQFGDVDSTFEQMVKDGKFKKRSASFYLVDGKPRLRHVGFLGAAPPAVKGLRDIQFASDAEAVAFDGDFQIADFSDGETMDDKTQQSIVAKVIEGIRGLLPKKDEQGATANFSEAAVKQLVEDSVKAATASFADEIKTRDTKIDSLEKAVNAQASKATRAEIVAFVEKQSNASLPPALRVGIVEFMETLDGGTADASRKVTVIEFTEDGGVKKETKSEFSQLAYFKKFIEALPPFIQFGEAFGGLNATRADNAAAVPPERVNQLREGAGLPPIAAAK